MTRTDRTRSVVAVSIDPPSLSPLSPLYSIPLTELIDLLGPDFDIDLEIERARYQKKP